MKEPTAARPLRLLVLGATGGTGKAVVEQAIRRGHQVTALVRSPEKLTGVGEQLVIRKGDPTKADELEAALAGQDVVVSALGLRGLGPSTILSDAARATVRAMKAAGVHRLLVVSAGMLFDESATIALMLRRTILKNIAMDSAAMERVLAESDLDWTIARPPQLTNGPLTRRYVAAERHVPADSRLWMSRADVANFLLDQVDRPAHIREVVGLGTPVGRARPFVYWLATLVLATECIVGGVMGALRMPPFIDVIGRLGYPPYFGTILGVFYVLAGLAILAPRFPRLKEWAYAGLLFNYVGAIASHLALGQGAETVIGPLIFLALALASWWLRPSARSEPAPAPTVRHDPDRNGRVQAGAAMTHAPGS
jgi:putative NADH-flavin reductase/uncharacterized membrane protein YphA (DoxX/SURF4 family)